MSHVRLFLSTVTDEFESYRDALRHELARPNVTVHIQEDFIATGTETLDKLDDYICGCDAVIHLAGDMTGAWAKETALRALALRYLDLTVRLPFLDPSIDSSPPRYSYTQWEAYLAVYHRKPLLIAVPIEHAPRGLRFQKDNECQRSQEYHLRRLRSLGRYPEIAFASIDQLATRILRSTVLDLLVKAGVSRPKPIALPYPSLGELFKGRDAFMAELRNSLQRAAEGQATAIVGKTLYGLGGVGKTRLAVEYAWQHRENYSALLFVAADTPADLRRNLAALVGPMVLDLPEQNAKEEERRIAAALHWLQQNPQWFLIIDNVDTPGAAAAVESLLARLHGGQVVITSRLSNWSKLVERLELDVLDLAPAAEFLLQRTAGRRRNAANDPTEARSLAQELGQLALALEQAGAYIDKHRLTFAQYRAAWQTSRGKVSAWFDPQLMHYPKSIAATWQTSFDQLSSPARLLLGRLSWLSSEPIPETLTDVTFSGASEIIADPHEALAELEAYSLATRASTAPTFTIHPLVQRVTRNQSEAKPSGVATQAIAWIKHAFRRTRGRQPILDLSDALNWIDAAFTGHPLDVRVWPTLNPLVPHVRVVVQHADAADIARPTASLMSRLGLLLRTKTQFDEAEAFFRRALAIREQTLPPDDSEIALSLNHLGMLYYAQGKLSEAESLLRRALAIREKAHHRDIDSSRRRLALIYRAQGRHAEANALSGDIHRASVFMSAPADARIECERTERVLERLNNQFTTVNLEGVNWDTRFYSSHSFQAQIQEAAHCEIVVAIFRGRLGASLPDDFLRMPNGEPFPSSTAYEVLSAIEACKKRDFPDVYVFRCREPPNVNLRDPNWSYVETQWQKLEAFFETLLRATDRNFMNFQTFDSTDEFETIIERTLIDWLNKHGYRRDVEQVAEAGLLT